MKRRIPDYYQRFRCIGSACTDSCCVGWVIDIDDEAYEDYCGVQGEFGERLRKSIDHTKPHQFIMEGDRCPFLNSSNLCDIYIRLGGNRLCQICTDHPRFYGTYGGRQEAGLGLVCEEAARLILNNKDKVHFIEEGTEQEEEDSWLQILDLARDRFILLLQERQRPLVERLGMVLARAWMLQEDYNRQDGNSMERHVQKLEEQQIHIQQTDLRQWLGDCIEFLQSLEVLSVQWEGLLRLASGKIRENDISFSYADPVFYEQLMIYFVYRYFMQSVYDFRLLDKIRFGIVGCLIVRGLEAVVSDQTQTTAAEIARLYSKEIEYSEENMQALSEEFLFSEIFEVQELLNAVSMVFES